MSLVSITAEWIYSRNGECLVRITRSLTPPLLFTKNGLSISLTATSSLLTYLLDAFEEIHRRNLS